MIIKLNQIRRIGLALAIWLSLGLPAMAQGLEVGGGLGLTSMTGDLVRGYSFDQQGPAIQLFLRYNLSNVVSVRGSGMVGRLIGNERDFPIDPFSTIRRRSFERLVLESALTLEYHFLDYKERNSLINWSPYFFGGPALTAYTSKDPRNDYSRIQPVIPFGLGVKYRLNKQWNLEFEFGARKTFFDFLDKVSEVDNPNKLNPEYGNNLDDDFYYYTGIAVSYTFYSVPCPFKAY